MSALKKIFGGGDSQDDEVLYQTEGGTTTASTATENIDRNIQSSRDIGTGAENKEGLVSKIGNTGTIESQTAGTSASPSTGDSNVGRNTAIAGAIAGAGTTVYASDRIESDDKPEDLSKATYTERSYPLSSDSTTGPTTSESRTAEYPTGYSVDPNAPGRAQDSGVAAAGLGLSGVAAAGAGGAAVGASSQRHGGIAAAEREGHYGRPPSSPPVSPPQSPSTTQSHFGTGAAVAGGAAVAAGAAGAYAATSSGTNQTNIADKIDPGAPESVDSDRVKEIESHYARTAAGAGAVTTVGAGAGYAQAKDDGSQVVTDSTGRPVTQEAGSQSNDDDRAKDTGSGAVKEVETHYGRDAAAVGAVTAVGAGAGYAVASSDDNRVSTDASGQSYLHKKSVEEPGEKKQGFFSKVLHGEKKEQEIPIGDSNPSNEVQRAPPPGTVGEDSGRITLVNEAAGAGAPVLVVREKPEGQT